MLFHFVAVFCLWIIILVVALVVAMSSSSSSSQSPAQPKKEKGKGKADAAAAAKVDTTTNDEKALRLAQSTAALLTRAHDILVRLASESASGDLSPEVRAALTVPLCRLTKMIIPNVHQKIDEHVYAADHPEYVVNAHQHGADLVAVGDATHKRELKVSVATVANKHTCNFNWNVPALGKPLAVRRAELLASVREKTAGGGATFVIRDGLGRELASYTLSDVFLQGYFARIPLGDKTRNHNLRAARCPSCHAFHRLAKLQKFSDLYRELTAAEWASVMGQTLTDCGVKAV
jgi:hypothetical protein